MMQVYPTEIWVVVIFLLMGCFLIGVVTASPFLPYLIAKFTKKKILIMVDKAGQLKLMSADIRNGMYYLKSKPMRFIKQYPGSYRLGGVDIDIVHADRGFVLKPEFQAAIAELKEKYDIDTYLELRKALIEGRIKEEFIDVPLFFKVPLDEIANYAATVPPSSIQGEIDDLFSTRLMDPMGGFGKYLPLIVILCIVVIVAAVAVKIIG
jgi:hypothetical protein